jgi:hypothetical protein
MKGNKALKVPVRSHAALALAVILSGCASVCPSTGGPSIVGVWELKPSPSNSYGLTSSCRASVEYRPDGTFVTHNGEMEIIGRYQVGVEDGVLYSCTWDMRGNGGRSCQGNTSDFVISNSRLKRRIAIEGNVLKTYLSKDSYFLFERRAEQ